MRLDDPSLEYREMEKFWTLIEDLLQGTSRMQSKSRDYLPQEPFEKNSSYKLRKSRSFLTPAYEDTIEKLSHKPFVKPVTFLGGELPEELQSMPDNIDLEGSSLTSFSKDLFETGINYGKIHLLVDHPNVPENISRADEISLGARPYFVNIVPSNLIWWEWEKVNGEKILTEIRVKERKNVVVEDHEIEKEFIRVWTPTTIQLFEKNAKSGDLTPIGEENVNTLGKIPLVTAYFNRTGFFIAKPPCFKLAESNLEHFQVYSDFSNILRIASLGILFGTGFSEKQIKQGIKISVNGWVGTTSENANLRYVEYEGKALDSLLERIGKIEIRMEQLGLQPLISSPGKVTATRDRITDVKTQAPVQTWIGALENLIWDGFQLASEWRDIEFDDDITVNIFSDFIISARTSEDLSQLREMRKQRDLSLETYLSEVKRRQVLSEGLDLEEEKERIDNELDTTITLPDDDSE